MTTILLFFIIITIIIIIALYFSTKTKDKDERIDDILENKIFGEEVDNDAWATLGVFQLVMAGLPEDNAMMQLSISQSGMISGSFVLPSTDKVFLVKGALHKSRQRVAFIVSNRDDFVYDVGLSNLIQERTNILVHSLRQNAVGTYSLRRRSSRP